MTDHRPDPDQAPERRPHAQAELDELLDFLHGELAEREAARLRTRLESEPALADAHRRLERLLEAERRAFEPAEAREALEADAPRVAAWVRSAAAAAEPVADRQRAAAPTRQRGWARILAFSVAMHVLALGVLALVWRATPEDDEQQGMRVSVESRAGYSEREPDYASTQAAVRWQELVLDDPTDLSDPIVLGEQETLTDLLPEADVPFRARRPLDYPVGVFKSMTQRRLPALKRRRLNLLGFNAKGTLNAVAHGLRHLARMQESDGSMPAGGDRSRLEQTGLTLLAFMADGHCSQDAKRDPNGKVVAQGVAWMRKALFGKPADERFTDRGFAELGLATVVLCEDYMLSYGWLSPARSQERATEIGRLVAAVREREFEERRADFADEQPWTVWACDAAARAGVVTPDDQDRQSFDAWLAEAVDTETAPGDASPLSVFAMGTALLFEERGAEKPRFTEWGQTHGEALAAKLDVTGKARTGDPVGDTALILLALQVAYRTY